MKKNYGNCPSLGIFGTNKTLMLFPLRVILFGIIVTSDLLVSTRKFLSYARKLVSRAHAIFIIYATFLISFPQKRIFPTQTVPKIKLFNFIFLMLLLFACQVKFFWMSRPPYQISKHPKPLLKKIENSGPFIGSFTSIVNLRFTIKTTLVQSDANCLVGQKSARPVRSHGCL